MRNHRITLAVLAALSAPPLSTPVRAATSLPSRQADPVLTEAGDAGFFPDGRGTVLYDQTQAEYPDDVLSFDANGSSAGFGVDTSYAADDFFIGDPAGWTVVEVDIDGTFRDMPGVMNVDFFPDVRGLPGPIPLCRYQNLENYPAPGQGTIRRFLIPFPTGCHLPPGKTWVSVYGYGRFTAQGGYLWGAFSPEAPLGNDAIWKNPLDGFGTGCAEWTPLSRCGFDASALGFLLLGTGTPTSFDEIFSNGFDSAGGYYSRPVLDAGFEQTSADGGSNPYWPGRDGNPSASEGGIFIDEVTVSDMTDTAASVDPRRTATHAHIVGKHG